MVTFRFATAEDAAALAAIYAPYCEQTAISFETMSPTPGEMTRRLVSLSDRFPWLVAAADGQVVGYAYARPHHEREAYAWATETSIYLDRIVHRRGLGRALYQRLFALLKLQGYRTIIAGATLPNPGSIGLHEAMGFRPMGIFRQVGWKMGAWHDVAWMQLELQARVNDPSPPVPIRALRDEAAVREILTGD